MIWKYDYKAIGNNPNKVPVGTVLKTQKREQYAADEVKFARENWTKWKSFQ